MSEWMQTVVSRGDPDPREASESWNASPTRSSLGAATLSRMLDIVGYAMVLVVEDGRVVFANQFAREELQGEHPLRLQNGTLQLREPLAVPELQTAIEGALYRSAQAMVSLPSKAGGTVSVSVVPVRDISECPAALLILEKRSVCEELSADAFARAHALTLAETRVLKQLCAGTRPGDIAQALGVKLTTVRTQIGSIRSKIGSRDITDILRRVSRLPPLPSLMRRA